MKLPPPSFLFDLFALTEEHRRRKVHFPPFSFGIRCLHPSGLIKDVAERKRRRYTLLIIHKPSYSNCARATLNLKLTQAIWFYKKGNELYIFVKKPLLKKKKNIEVNIRGDSTHNTTAVYTFISFSKFSFLHQTQFSSFPSQQHFQPSLSFFFSFAANSIFSDRPSEKVLVLFVDRRNEGTNETSTRMKLDPFSPPVRSGG